MNFLLAQGTRRSVEEHTHLRSVEPGLFENT